jgi:hypothetical protein
MIGTIKSGNIEKGYIVEFDIFPSHHKKYLIFCQLLKVMKEGEEEAVE